MRFDHERSGRRDIVNAPNPEVSIEMVRQRWQHLRHLEIVRAGFATFYAAMVVAGLGILTRNSAMSPRPLSIVLDVFSVAGLLLSVRLYYDTEFQRNELRELAQELGVSKQRLSNYGPPGWSEAIRVRNLFLAVYLLGIGVFTWLSIVPGVLKG